ncbi:glucosamine-6-phosphate deaminase [Nonomuraea sp. NPDC004580]|uniref:glucosamine-6-phosphate deaminase n=1 Tax=Nonomuraea sp. NPDC004580 TaxID=3154552 RepID=UPI0033BCD4D3
MSTPLTRFTADSLPVEVHPSEADLGRAAAERAAATIGDAVARRGAARVVIATGNSQYAFTDALREQEIPWDRVTVFHMDEYVGIAADHPASFRRWIKERIEDPFAPAAVHYIDGNAPDPEAECARYEAELRTLPLDLVCMGIGENGHLAFNEPHQARFDDDRWARVITLTQRSREQQVGEGHFATVADVPATAISLTVPALLTAASVQVCVPEQRKAAAVAATLTDPVSPACPATILRRTPRATLFLDPDSAGKLDLPR